MSAKAIYEFDAEPRTAQGKGASRRLRRLEDKVPAILYGGNQPPQNLSLTHRIVMHALEHPTVYSHILTLNMGSKKQQVILKALQRHPYKKAVLHMDFLRVNPTDVITMKVALNFVGADEAPGVEAGGIVNHRLSELDIRCQVQDLPTSIEVDISKLAMDLTLHISDLKLPKGVESVALSHGAEHDHPVVAIHLPRAAAEDLAEDLKEASEEAAEEASKEDASSKG